MTWTSKATTWQKKKNTVEKQRPTGKIPWLISRLITPKYIKKTYKEVRKSIEKIGRD